MIFTSLEFLIFFIIIFFLFFLVNHAYRWGILLVASYFFYAYSEPINLIYLIIPTIVCYWLGIRLDLLEKGAKKKILLFFGIASGAILLLIFKYTNFIVSTFNFICEIFTKESRFEPIKFLLPIGISFYSFKLISYIIDVYNERLKAETHLGYFALYVSFFPQLLAGPIDRAVNFIPQLKKKITFDYSRIIEGLRLVAWGFFKKLVIANELNLIVNNVYDNVQKFNGAPLIVATIAYSFQIYCDFSGYTDIAIGLSRIFGYNSIKNFDSPYSSESITNFWNKWHISLSTWLRDYLFLPIAYSIIRRIKLPRLAKIKAETWGYIGGMSVTMFLGGLWHGASWTFVLWGILHGVFLIFSYSTKKLRRKWVKRIKLKKFPKLHKFIRIISTFSLITFAWIFFRANSISDAFYITTHLHVGVLRFFYDIINSLIFDFSIEPLKEVIIQIGIPVFLFNKVLIVIGIMEIVQFTERKTQNISLWFSQKSLVFRWSCYFILLTFIVFEGKYDIKEFIYFQF